MTWLTLSFGQLLSLLKLGERQTEEDEWTCFSMVYDIKTLYVFRVPKKTDVSIECMSVAQYMLLTKELS